MNHKKPICDVCIDCRKIAAAVRMMENDTDFAMEQIASNKCANVVTMLKRTLQPGKLVFFLKNDLEDWGLSVALSRFSVPHAVADVIIQYHDENDDVPARIRCGDLVRDMDARAMRQLFIALWDTPESAPLETIKAIMRAHLRDA